MYAEGRAIIFLLFKRFEFVGDISIETIENTILNGKSGVECLFTVEPKFNRPMSSTNLTYDP